MHVIGLIAYSVHNVTSLVQ